MPVIDASAPKGRKKIAQGIALGKRPKQNPNPERVADHWKIPGVELPDTYVNVIVVTDDTFMQIGFVTETNKWFCPVTQAPLTVGFWMDLPEYPELYGVGLECVDQLRNKKARR